MRYLENSSFSIIRLSAVEVNEPIESSGRYKGQKAPNHCLTARQLYTEGHSYENAKSAFSR